MQRHHAEASRFSTPLNVLYLEDSQQDAEQVVSHLARNAPHIHIDLATTPEQLLKMFAAGGEPEYGVLLLDYKLPARNSIELLADLRWLCGDDGKVVVLITALGNEEIAVQALRMGVSDYVAKRNGYLLKLPSVLESAYHRTALSRAHRKLLESEVKYRTLVENLPVVAYTTSLDKSSTVGYIGPQIKELLGYTVEEWLDSPGIWARSLHPDDKAWTVDERSRCNAQLISFEAEYRMVAKDGRVVWVRDTAPVIRDASGEPAFRQGVVSDITNRQEMEVALIESEERYRDLFENANDIIFTSDIEGNLTSVNRVAEISTGYPRDELMSTPVDVLMERQPLEQRSSIAAELAAGKSPRAFEREIIAKDGHRVSVEISLRPAIKGGKVIGLQGIARDISRRKRAEEGLRESLSKLQRVFTETVQAMSRTVEMRDPYTAGHEQRVAKLARAIGEKMGLSPEQLEGIDVAGQLHDVGKIAVPAEILSRPGKLSDHEFSLIKVHPQMAYDILKDIEFPWPVAEIVRQHHERLDGSGYPDRLTWNDILIEARVLAVADVVEAMISHRPYRAALPVEEALEGVSKTKGTSFDPVAVDACLDLFAEGAIRSLLS